MGIATVKQIVVVVCGFILPRYILLYYGSAINGLVSSITHFLGFISLLELGVGSVVQANLYKPLADNDEAQISRVIVSSERFFRRLALIFLAYIAVLFVIYPLIINNTYDYIFTASLLLIISVSTFAQYFFGMTYQLLLNADQKAYIQIILNIVTVLLNTVLSIVLMKLGASIHIVKLTTAAVFVIRPLGQALYVKKHYHLDKTIILTEEPIKQKWNGLSQHLASVVTNNVDVVLLTLFSTLESISVYNVYHMVTNGVTQIIMMAATGIESLFGNMYAKGETELLNRAFAAVELFVHAMVSTVFSLALVAIVPFIMVYTRGVTDTDYYQPLFGVLLVVAYASQCLRIPYFRMIKAAGRFKETQNGAFISMGLNIGVSILLIFKFGLVGIAIGTFIAMFYHTVYFVWYLRKHVLHRSIIYFVKYLISDSLIFLGSYFITRYFYSDCATYTEWIVFILKCLGVVLALSIMMTIIFHSKEMKELLVFLRKRNNYRQIQKGE
jgi:Na+-driven multidrug efflux pump